MKLVVGLGNPGDKYAKTRHNIGFEVVKALAEEMNAGNFKTKFQGNIAEANYKGEKVLILTPQTFMNLSGNSVIEVCKFYKIDPSDVIVIYDDMDIPFSKIRIRPTGSAGGHNGMKSIISHIGKDFLRVRCGIGKPVVKMETINFVLGKFSKESEKEVQSMINLSIDAIKSMCNGDAIEKVMTKFN